MSERVDNQDTAAGQRRESTGGQLGRIAVAWAFVGIPLAYGIFETVKKAAALFTG